MRLVDGDELLTAFPVDDEPMLTKSCVRMTIRQMPTVDAVPVVRCKDCMHYGVTDNRIPEEQIWWCYFWDDVRSPDAYCSDGEREDGEEHD